MPQPSGAPRRRSESYRELVTQTAAILSRDVPIGDLIAAARRVVADFFTAQTAVIVLCRGDDDAREAEATLAAIREPVFAERTMRVLRGGAALRPAEGRSLHAPIRFGGKLLGAVAVMCPWDEAYAINDLGLLESWATLIAVHFNGLQLAAHNVALEALVGSDALTGLRNRRGLDAEVELAWRTAVRTGESVALVMVDIDFFKGYNDAYGHLAGDRCLQQIAATIAAGLRPGDIAARFGGEEFVALLRDADVDRATKIAERLRENVVALQIAHSGSSLALVTASFGVATALPRSGAGVAETLAAADENLYVAKVAGRNRVAAQGYMSTSPFAEPHYGEHNLPATTSSFCGRVDDVAAVLAALDRSRLVSLVAFGGVGKTRLSIEVAGKRRGSFRNGVWFVDLAGSADPELLPERVAAAIGLADIPDSRTIAGVTALLAGRELLIVLDNCEHLIAACARFCADVLSGAPAVRILATSRERLGLPGELVVSLAPLEIPPADATLGAADVNRYAALKLFFDRANAVAPLVPSAQNIATIAHVCRRLDGIALAIELTAARTRILSLDELRGRLDASFSVVGRPGAAGSARQRTLHGLIDWSYDLLDERERRIFSRLAIFAGSFTLESAAAVCGGDDGADVLDIVEELVDKSLVVLDVPDSGSRMFRLFDAIRDYARTRLVRAGEVEELERRLIGYMGAHGAAIDAARSAARWRTAMLPLEHSIVDVRACLEATIVAGNDPLAGARLAANLAEYWQVHGRAHEGRTWLERALRLADVPPGLRAKLINAYVWSQPLFGDAWRSERLASEALELATQAGDDAQISVALFHLGDAAFDLGDFARARDMALRAVDRFVAAGDLFGEAYAGNCVGAASDFVQGFDGVPSGNYSWYNRSIEICRQIERQGFAARVLGNVAESEFFLGHIEAGIAMTKDALADVERENDRPAVGWLLCNLGLFYQSTAEYEIAKGMLLDALRVVLEIRDDWLTAACCDNLAGIALAFARPEQTARFLACSDRIFADIALARQPQFARLAQGWRDGAIVALGAARFESESAAGRRIATEDLLDAAQALTA